MMRCGDLGHKNRNGDPCAKPQGLGVRGADTGPCRYHTESVQGTRKVLKKRVVEYLPRADLTLLEVGRKVGRAPHTITIWFLKNRAPDRWQDKVERQVTGPDRVPRIPIEALQALLDDDQD